MIDLSPVRIRLSASLHRRPRMQAWVKKVAPGFVVPANGSRLADIADKAWVLCAAESTVIRPATFDEADLTRVTGVDADSSREIEWKRIRGGPLDYRPSVAYRIRDAVLSKGHVLHRQLIRPVTTEPSPLWGRYGEIEEEPTLLTATFNGSRYFGHWMMDELTRLIAASAIGKPVAPPRPMSAHQLGYLRMLGIPQPVRTDVLFRQLVIIDDRTQNSYRRERYAVLRKCCRAGRTKPTSTGVMLLRKRTGVSRVLVNEEQLAELLTRRGFVTLCPTEHSVDDILDACLDAKVVVGVEGSQLAHALLVMDGEGTLLTLQPPSRFNNILKTYCDGLGLRYAFAVGQPSEHGFTIDCDAVLRLLDRLP